MNQSSASVQEVAVKESSDNAVYDYSFDLESGRSASRVARLVGKNKTILEVGCGPGSQSKVFREQLGCEVVGVEIDPARAEKARTYCREVHVANLETDDLGNFLKEEKFDVVVCADVLEHLRNPEELLLRLKHYLKADGYLVTSIPNITHASIVYEMVHGRFEYQTQGLLDSTHIKFFSCASALSIVEDAGYWVADLQKARFLSQHTEFKTNPISAEDKQILAVIRSRNPDADTYQFIIKAYPLNNGVSHDNNGFTMRETIRQLQGKISSYETELQQLRSTINWYRIPFIVRLFKRFNPLSRISVK
jgi:2-polyprenyl-3-methyl-5-hydroxy-6-metoxy-1,4-benzoquinol methylase